jgi:hypothetical protein
VGAVLGGFVEFYNLTKAKVPDGTIQTRILTIGKALLYFLEFEVASHRPFMLFLETKRAFADVFTRLNP